jgi:ribosome-binding factor A
MTRRTERVGNLIRNTLGQILLAKMSDPRFDPVKTSITRVEVPEDLLTAKVYISVAGNETEQNLARQALQHAAGYLQERMMDQIELRHTPRLEFVIDTQFRKTLDTLKVISEVAAELRDKDAAHSSEEDSTAPDDEASSES